MATPLNIKDPEAWQLASLIANATGKTLTRVAVDALRAEAARVTPGVDAEAARKTLADLRQFPVVDARDWKELIYAEGEVLVARKAIHEDCLF